MHILLGDVTWQRVVKSNPPNNSNCYCLNNDELIMQLWESDTFASVNLCPSSVGFRHSAKLPQRFRNSNRNENERIKWAVFNTSRLDKISAQSYMQPAGPADNDILFFGRFSPKLLFDISWSNFRLICCFVIKFLLYDNKCLFECGLL